MTKIRESTGGAYERQGKKKAANGVGSVEQPGRSREARVSALESELLGPVVTGVIISSISAFFAQRWRHSFEKRMSSDLEVLKTELTFDAEVRRRVGSMRVEVLGLIAAQSVVLRAAFANLADTVNEQDSDYGDVEDSRGKLNATYVELDALLNRTAHLFSKDVAAEFRSQMDRMCECRNRATSG